MASLSITQLAALAGVNLTAADLFAVVDVSASETKNIRIDQLAIGIAPLFPDKSIPGDKVDYTIPPDSIGTAELQDGSVTGVKLADNSHTIVGPRPITGGEHIGQLCIDNGIIYVWGGATWDAFDTANAVINITYDSGPVILDFVKTGNAVNVTTAFEETTGPAEFLAGPTASGGVVAARQIVGLDLPVASDAERGAVQVDGNGLEMNGDVIGLSNTVAPSNGVFQVVDYDEHGQVIDGRIIEPADLPIATSSTNGICRPGTGLTVDNSGALNHANFAAPDTYTKVTVDSEGHVTAGAQLTADDIPGIDAGNIVGEITTDQLAECSVTAPKICDYATTLMQEDHPGAGDFLGQYWYTPSTAQLRVYSRGSGPQNIWLPVGFGVLAQQNLRLGFTYDATTARIITVTSYGTIAGLAAGELIPAGSDELLGVYGVCVVDGNAITVPQLNGVTHTPGDWILCLGATEGWVHIDVGGNGGGGGGSGVERLNDLLDVSLNDGTIDTIDLDPIPSVLLQDGHLLKYNAVSGMWRNTNIIDGGTF